MRNISSKKTIQVSEIRAVAVDLDGTTLRNNSVMSDRTITALRSCHERNIAVMICTGRSPVAAESFRAAIGATGPMVFYNGATVIDAPDGAVLASTLLEADIVAFCLELARSLDAHFHGFLPDDRLVFERRRDESAVYEKRTGLRGTVVDMTSLLAPGGAGANGFIKTMFIAEGTLLDRIQLELGNKFGSRIYCARSHATFLEIMAPGVSKGNALRIALSLRGVESSATIAFGDAENDLPMLREAGLGIAVANASPDVREAADELTLSNEEDGVAVYIEKLFSR